MDTESITFGDFLKKLIKEKDMTQFDFYTQLGIKKPYFYDIVSGKANPPPPPLQIKAMDILKVDEETRLTFYDLAAKGRRELPADIQLEISDDPSLILDIRALLNHRKK